MILSDGDIHKRLKQGDLVIEPLADPDLQIQPASVDLRLGPEFLEFNRTNIACIHPDREEEVDEYVTSTSVAQGAGDEQTTLVGYDADDRRTRNEFILHPGDFVLGTTMERVEIPHDLIAHVEGRSSLGRLAIVVHASLPYDEHVFLWTPTEGYGFYEIGAVVEAERPAFAVSFDPRTLGVNTHEVTDYIVNPKQRIYEVTLESGRQVRVTKDHNLFTVDAAGEVTRVASENAEGTYVMVPRRLPDARPASGSIDLREVFDEGDDVVSVATDGAVHEASAAAVRDPRAASGEPPQATAGSSPETAGAVEVGVRDGDERVPRTLSVTPDLGWVIGLYIASGAARGSRLQFDHRTHGVLARAAAWFDQYDAAVTWHTPSNGPQSVSVRSKLFAQLFRELAGHRCDKTIPPAAWDWPDAVLEALHDGLLTGTHGQEAGESFGTTNSELADQIMYLATRLGRRSTIHRETECGVGGRTSTREDAWIVDFSETNDDRFPTPTTLLNELHIQAADLDSPEGNALAAILTRQRSPGATDPTATTTRPHLREIATKAKNAGFTVPGIDRLLSGDVGFEKVTRVQATDRIETTYDLEVQPRGRLIENFLGGRGGIFLSNTAGIVDPGYRGQITLELSNLGTAPVALTPGMRISQLTFTELTSPAERPYGSDRGSKYQDQHGPQASRIQSDHEFLGDQK